MTDISFVIPFMNEEPTLEPLVTGIADVMADQQKSYEILLIDDGSTDGGAEKARHLCHQNSAVRLIKFLTNYGKAAALSAGFRQSEGDLVITMDADLQDDPAEIPKLLAKLEEGYDLVSGWKKTRYDPLSKRLPSKLFNGVVNRIFGMDIHDHNCGFKVYRRRAVERLDIYGELHRFTPALAHAWGMKVSEVAVQHHPREFGQSKYGVGRLIKGFLDLLTMVLITRYRWRPLHFFGLIALVMATLGGGILIYLTIQWWLGVTTISERPILFLGITLIILSGQFLGIGLIAEFLRAGRITERDKYMIEETYSASPDSQD